MRLLKTWVIWTELQMMRGRVESMIMFTGRFSISPESESRAFLRISKESAS